MGLIQAWVKLRLGAEGDHGWGAKGLCKPASKESRMAPSAGAYRPFEGFTTRPSLDKEATSFFCAKHPRHGGLTMLLPFRLERRSQTVALESRRVVMHLIILCVALTAAVAASLH